MKNSSSDFGLVKSLEMLVVCHFPLPVKVLTPNVLQYPANDLLLMQRLL